jgi:hypothetical protein
VVVAPPSGSERVSAAAPILAAGAVSPECGAPEADIARDLLRRALPAVPPVVIVAALVAGAEGAVGATVGIALVLVNFAAAAASLAWAARVNLGVLMGVALFGYLLRVSALFGAVFVLRSVEQVHVPSLGITIVVTHLGLLAWEMRYVSASLAHPSLKPVRKEPTR